MNIIELIIAGSIFGLVGGPFILYSLGSLVVVIKQRRNQQRINNLKQDHDAAIKRLKKRYEKARDNFNKKSMKLQKYVSKVKTA